jgi:hypothetical protein
MPTRAKYLYDPEYERAFERALGTVPDRPYFEIFIPKKVVTKELIRAVMRPIWDMEISHVWQEIIDDMSHRGTSGDLLEFGVYRGQSFRKLIDMFAGKNLIERFYGFDSFQGLPRPDSDKDPSTWKEGAFSATKAEAWAYISRGLKDTSNIELIEGWFSKTLAEYRTTIQKIAFIRIDCDLYQSTVDVFEFVDRRLAHGAILYFDDWTHDHRTGETRAFFEFVERTASRYRFEKVVTVSDGGFAVRAMLV